jgi:hypothetical protein
VIAGIMPLLKVFSICLKANGSGEKLTPLEKEARKDVFDYIEMFYNPKRKNGKSSMLSPVEYEKQRKVKRYLLLNFP